MTEEETKAEELAKETKRIAFDKAQEELKGQSVDKLVSIINDTRSEAKDYRLDLKAFKEELEGLKGDKEKEEQEKQIADGKKDEVIAGLNEKVVGLTKESDKWNDYNTKKRAKVKEEFGENWLESFTLMDLNDLEALRDKFNVKPNPEGDNGANGGRGEFSLTAAEKKAAKDRGISEEDYHAILSRNKEIKSEKQIMNW